MIAYRLILMLAVFAAVVTSNNTCCAQQIIVLRDLSLVRNDGVVSFDRRGVVLQSQRKLRWSQIRQATVEHDKQMEFDKFVLEVGLPLFRLESRLKNGDWAGLVDLVEPLYQKMESNSQPDPHNEFMICVAAMRARIYDAKRHDAVEPYLRAAAVAKTESFRENDFPFAELNESVDGTVSPELVPLWFDRIRTMSSFTKLNRALRDGKVDRNSISLIYLASMAITSENYGVADQLLSEAGKSVTRSSDPVTYDWLTLIESHRNFASGDTGRGRRLVLKVIDNTSDDSQRAFAFYLLGTYSNLESPGTQLLNLIVVPALFGRRYSDLSAAALHQAVTIAKDKGDSKQARILRNELLQTYPNTYHGRLAAVEVNP